MASKASNADVPPGNIHLSLNATTPEQLADMIAGLARAFGGYDKLAEKIVSAGASTDPLTGASTAALDVATAPAPTSLPEPEVSPKARANNPNKQGDGDKKVSPAVPAANVVGDTEDLSKVRDEAIQKLTEHFGKNPTAISDLAALQKKFGVRLFKDIADDRVAEFAQDAHMLVNGSVSS